MEELLNIGLDGGSCIAWIRTDGESFFLSWTDGVANDWTEEFPDFSYALARLANLQYCAESDWYEGFTHQPAEFIGAFDSITGKEAK